MVIYIYNTSFYKVGMIEESSVIWTTRYYESGDFEIYFPFDYETYNLIQIEGFVEREGDTRVGVIENISINHDSETGDFITVTGKLAEGLLARRIIWNQIKLNGNIETKIRELVTNEVIDPVTKYGSTYANRKIDLIELGDVKNINYSITAQFTGTNLLEAISDLCKAASIGYKTYRNNNKIKFELYSGVNRSYSQNTNPYVVFSDENDNLNSSTYSVNTSDEYNVAIIAGEGEGLTRTRATLSGTETGRYRKEVYVDARDISSNEGEILSDEYQNLLLERGKESITSISEIFNGEIEVNTNQYKFGVDFNLGDIVTIENKKWGISVNQRIIEAIESEDENGYSLTLTFGN